MSSSEQTALQIWKDKLASLQTKEAIESDATNKFKIQQEIKECQQKIQEAKEDENNSIYNALLSLNYHKEVEIFQKFWIMNPHSKIGSFLILGEPKRGQRWLVNRLLNLNSLPDITTAKKIPISLTYNEVYIEDVWKKLSLALKSSASPRELVQRVYKHWQNETVIIVLHNINLMCSDERREIFEKFWKPLLNKIRQHEQPCESYLVMFLVDNKGNNWQMDDCVNDLNEWKFSQTIIIHILENFTKIILKEWIKTYFSLLNCLDDDEDIQKLVDYLWDMSLNGNAETLMDLICEHCGYSWSGINKQLAV